MGRGAIAGILSGGLALGVAQLVAGLITSNSSPVVAVGQLSIDFTPPFLKNFAISAFGSHDKLVLLIGILVVLAIFAAGIGILATRRLAYGMAGLAVFAFVGLVAAETRPSASLSDTLPTLAGAAAAALALRRLTRLGAESTAPARGRAAAAVAPSATRAAPPATGAPRPWESPAGPANPAGWSAPETPSARTALDAGPGSTAEPDAAGPADADQRDADPAGADPAGADPVAADPVAADPVAAEPGAEWSRPGVWRPGAQPAPGGPPSGGRPVSAGAPPPGQPRRSFLTTGAVVAGTALVAGVGGRLLAERGNVAAARKTLRIPPPRSTAPPLPKGVDLKIPGLSPFVTPSSKFYRVDTALVLPEVAPATWQLRIHGMVAREVTLSFHELIKQPLLEEYITLCCVSNPVGGPYIGNARWLGTSLSRLLRRAGIRAGADQLLCTSSDGFTSGTPIQAVMDGRDAMLAVAMNGAALPVAHGFPVRMVVPGLYGYVSATKWITDIEVTTFADSHAYWTDRGWDAKAPIKTQSRIDVPKGGASLQAGPTTVAGVAWAQHKGIDAVQVRVNQGAWHEARLAAVPGIDTWRQWAWDWTAKRGTHVIEARATDRTGYTQTAQQAPPEPNGATGYPSAVVQVG